MTPTVCSIEGCAKPVHGRGLCGTHHQRLLRNGHTDDPPLPRVGCISPEGCDRPHFAFGLCATHYQRRFKRRGYLKYTYQMTVAEWETLFDSQDRRCAVCLTAALSGASTWHVHHDHDCCRGPRSCGACVVAILCGPCNIGMGSLGDDIERLERAAKLMKEWRNAKVRVAEGR